FHRGGRVEVARRREGFVKDGAKATSAQPSRLMATLFFSAGFFSPEKKECKEKIKLKKPAGFFSLYPL
ncbi:MAG: hypothetical protein IJS78_04670, partial [Clostridia bacterium]|nr:hypothetical protein [Clostridia bacterium]